MPALAVSDARFPHAVAAQGLIAAGEDFWRRGWSLGTSSNYSVIVGRDPLTLLLTGSGYDKGALLPNQFVLVNEEGHSLHPSHPKPSAETLLHTLLARSAGAGAVLHTHSVYGTVLSEKHLPEGKLMLGGYEMLKGLEGITTHDTSIDVEIFANTQDIAALAKEVEARLLDPVKPLRYAFLIAGHGLYTWAADLAGARRQVEVLEFLFEVITRRRLLGA
ncbi:MAG: mtnB 2 [Verrucomicrobiaceae bacterium]|nr:mtnB 2 [Verrucomicrobiaceae bacterium]